MVRLHGPWCKPALNHKYAKLAYYGRGNGSLVKGEEEYKLCVTVYPSTLSGTNPNGVGRSIRFRVLFYWPWKGSGNYHNGLCGVRIREEGRDRSPSRPMGRGHIVPDQRR